MQYNMPMPPRQTGTPQQQLEQLYRYLFRMNEELSRVIESENVIVQDIATRQQQSVSSEELDKGLVDQYNQAKALIIKTADIVRSEMDKIVTELGSKYIAISEWGTYQEDIEQKIEATALGIVQEFDYQAQIDAVGADFETYRIESQGYIQNGIIGFDDENLPIYGIAVGQDLKNVTVTMADGTVHEMIDMNRNLATYTSDQITFWQNGIEVAHISNSEMVINKITTHEGLLLGESWEVSCTPGIGFMIKWIGG